MSKKDYRELDRAIIDCTPPPPTPKKLTAYEELKAWCEKHLEPEEFKDVPYTEDFFHCIYLQVEDDSVGFVGFFGNGSVAALGSVPQEDMETHIAEYEEQSRG